MSSKLRNWFFLVLHVALSRQAKPVPFTVVQFQQIKCSVLLLLGSRDGLVGDTQKTVKVVENISDVRVEILDTGHLISSEMPGKFNKLVMGFIEEE